MCEYCKNATTGNNYNPIVSIEFDFGFIGKMTVDTVILGDKFGNARIGIAACMDQADSNMEETVKMNFCPICGQKFGG